MRLQLSVLLLLSGCAWVTDAELRSVLWGKRGERMSRSALHQLIYNTRRIFEGWGLDGCIIEKEQGATRLCLEPECVSFSGEREAGSVEMAEQSEQRRL